MSTKIMVLVVGSLLLNVLLIGFIAGNMSQRWGDRGFLRGEPAAFVGVLPAEKENLFLSTMKDVRKGSRQLHREIRTTRENALKILSAPVFDETAYRAEVAKLHDLRGRMMQGLEEATITLAKQFGCEERKALAAHLQCPPGHRGGRGPVGRHHPGPPPPENP